MTALDIPKDILAEIAAHHDTHPDSEFCDFLASNGLVLATSRGGRCTRLLDFQENRIERCLERLLQAGNATLRVGDGTYKVRVTIKSLGSSLGS